MLVGSPLSVRKKSSPSGSSINKSELLRSSPSTAINSLEIPKLRLNTSTPVAMLKKAPSSPTPSSNEVSWIATGRSLPKSMPIRPAIASFVRFTASLSGCKRTCNAIASGFDASANSATLLRCKRFAGSSSLSASFEPVSSPISVISSATLLIPMLGIPKKDKSRYALPSNR